MEGIRNLNKSSENSCERKMPQRRTSRNTILMRKNSVDDNNFHKKIRKTLNSITNDMTSAIVNIIKPKTVKEISILSENNIENHNNNDVSLIPRSSATSETSDSGISNSNNLFTNSESDFDKLKCVDDDHNQESSPDIFDELNKHEIEESEKVSDDEAPPKVEESDTTTKKRRRNVGGIMEEVIEDVWDVTIRQVNNDYKMKFYVKWDNWAKEDNTYEPFEHVAHAECLQEYVNRKFEYHADRIEAAVFELTLNEPELQEEFSNKSRNFKLKKIEKFDWLYFKCCILAYIYTYSPVPKTCKFIQKLIYNCFWYKELQNKEKQEEQHSKVIETVESLDENIIMKIENKIDFQVIPKFNYLTKVEDNDDKKITTQIGCNCENGCFPASSCCAQLLDIKPAFDRFGELSATEHQLIVECGEFCGCDKTKCVNHVKKSKLNLCVFKTQTRGWALKTLQSIQAGSFVIEYTGELVDAENAKLRTRSYKKKGIVDQYLFDLDYNDMNEAIYSIDATQKGNLSRFINHSCSANLQTWPAIYPSEDKNKHRLYYFALRFIRAGEELTVDYSGGIIGGSPKKIPTNAKVCRCQSENCRGFIF